MPVVAAALGLLGWNYSRHRRQLQTFCQWLRDHVPPWAFVLGCAAFNSWFVPHVLLGYSKQHKEI